MSFYEKRKGETPEPSCVSMKSDVSMGMPPEFSGGAVNSDTSETLD